MAGFWNINLIPLFGFYLALMFLVSLYRRFAQYRAIGGLVLSGPGRWPRLLKLISEHHAVFFTWSMFLPALLALLLTLVHWLLYRVVMPNAQITIGNLAEEWLVWPVVLLLALAMIGVDLYGVVEVAQVDEREMSKHFDEAEYWLRSWTAPVVNFFTLGLINPRQLVSVEVRKALVEASEMINVSLWWLAVQVGLRVAVGLSLWLAFALYSHV
jgi:hypothetical protein